MSRARRISVLLAAAFMLASAGCTTPDAVSRFCAASNTTLTSSIPVFDDLKGSCLREKNLEQNIGTFKTVQSDPGCDAIGKQADGAVAAAQILSDYFTALNSLATVGIAGTAADASALATKTGAAVGSGSLAQKALGSMATFLTTAVTSGYQQRSLERDLVTVSNNIGVVTDALAQIVQRNYIDQELKAEEGKLATHYKEFAITHESGELTLDLDDRWHADGRALAAKRASAQQLIVALHTIRQGAAELAERAHSLKAKEVPGLLDPYITQLQTMIPAIQKGF